MLDKPKHEIARRATPARARLKEVSFSKTWTFFNGDWRPGNAAVMHSIGAYCSRPSTPPTPAQRCRHKSQTELPKPFDAPSRNCGSWTATSGGLAHGETRQFRLSVPPAVRSLSECRGHFHRRLDSPLRW